MYNFFLKTRYKLFKAIEKYNFNFFSYRFLNKAVIPIFIFIILLVIKIISITSVGAATFLFSQTNWSGGATTNTGIHPDNQSDWDEFFSKDTNLIVANAGAELKLSTTANTLTQTDDGTTTTGFNLAGSSLSSTAVNSLGASAKIELVKLGSVASVVAGGTTHALALKADGTVSAWGYNTQGQLGNGTTTSSYVPTPVSVLTSITSVATGGMASGVSSSYALKSNGTVWSWGFNITGQLGDGTTTQRNTPAQISSLSGITAIAAGTTSVFAVKSNGTLWAWGNNYVGVGQLGIGVGTTVYKLTPVQVVDPTDPTGYFTNAVRVATNGTSTNITSSYALKSDGSVWSWGSNTYGQLGDGTTNSRNVPGPVSVLGVGSGVIDIAAAAADAYALKSDGSVWAWGSNNSNQLGDGTATDTLVPIQVPTLGPGSGVIAIASGITTAYALKSDGSVWAWGSNTQAQAGSGSATYSVSPPSQVVNLGPGSGVVTIGASYKSAFAVKSDGSMWAWGNNTVSVGQLGIGDGTANPRSTPVRVGVSGNYFDAGHISYATSGIYTSGVVDLGIVPQSLSTLGFNATLPASTSITMVARAGDSTNTADGSWTSWSSNISNGGSISALAPHRYVQYKATLTTTDDIVTPSLEDVTFNYNQYPATQSLTSSPYNTSDSANIIGAISFDEDATLPTGTSVTVSLRTAGSQSGLTSATWNNFTNATSNCAKTDTNVACSIDAIPSTLKDSSADQWWQYKVTLTSTGANTPTVTGVAVTYVVNAPPELQNITASQGTDGLVTISYDVRDSDTTSGDITPGYVTPSFEYWNGTTWVTAATLSSGATSDKAVDGTNFTTYGATWNPKIDLNTQYLTTAKVRVKVNDNEVANNLATLASSTFTLDTKNPVVNSFILDARSDATDNITISVTEDTLSQLQMKISNNSDLSADGLNGSSGSWIDYSSTNTWVFAESNPVVFYQIKDVYGNLSSGGAISSVALPPTPINTNYQDVSNAGITEWREFIAWDKVTISSLGFKRYNIYRSTDGTTYSLLSTQTNNATNFHLDTGLDTATTYYYKINAEDNAGNISAYSNIVSDTPDGVEGGGSTPPIISNIVTSNVTVQSALVSWDTDQLSNSTVYYSNTLGDFTNAPSVGVATVVSGGHSVFLSGLTPGLTYYIQVSSANANGGVSTDTGGDASFITSSGPVISNVQSTAIQNTSASITWVTTESSNSHVIYSTNASLTNPVDVAVSSSTTSHSVPITGLTANTAYYYYVTSGVTEDKHIVQGEVQYYTFTTTYDITQPVITFDPETDITDITETSVTISWVTDDLASSSIEYSTDTSYSSTDSNNNLNTNHSFGISGLTKGTLYNLRLKSTDVNGNLTTLTDLTFLTDDLSDVTPPVISSLSAEEVFDTTAIISWTTNEPANSLVEYGNETGVYSLSTPNALFNYSHTVVLTGLTVSTLYYFRVTSEDGSVNSVSSDELTFTTSAMLTTGGGGSHNTDSNAPTISNVLVKDIGRDMATVEWSTDEIADSAVEFGKTETYGLASINRTTVQTHSQIITWLSSDTLYHYRITSADASGNVSSPYVGTLVTLKSDGSDPTINSYLNEAVGLQEQNDRNFSDQLRDIYNLLKKASGNVSRSFFESSLFNQKKNMQELALQLPAPKIIPPVKIKTLEDLAIVSWETDDKTNSLIAYSDSVYPLTDPVNAQVIGNPDIFSNEHQVILPGLAPDTKYNYQIRGETIIGSPLVVLPDTFITPSKIAKIENYVIDRLTDSSALFKWASSLPTDTSVRITPYRNNALSYDEAKIISDPKLTLLHQMTIKNFEPGVFYKVDLYGNDESKRTLSQSVEAFSTASKELPFIIDQVKTSSALSVSGGLKVQSIISWNTTKLATSKVYYRKGASKDDDVWPFESPLDNGYARNHLVVMTDFASGEVYQFQVESIDSNGQKTRSKTYTILTPRQKESVFQVIFKNVEQTFGWVGGGGK